ncbi:MAG: hypothetical protein IT330_09650 [Anaerolineae bacterium]|nr:hypothetical protein [Anaerolineae bacterium]
MRLCLVLILAIIISLLPPVGVAADGPLPLSAYPRPPRDNGFGIHWTTQIYGSPSDAVDYFVDELTALGVRWVKFLNDGTDGRHNDYLIKRLVERGIMPVMRIYFRCNHALDLDSLRRLVDYYRPRGVFYYELFNEPEIPGEPGGWCDGEQPDPERLLNIWIPAARVIQQAGGFPAVPSLFPPSLKDPKWQGSFFVRFFQGLKRRGETSILFRSWGAVHNYFLNHPPDYPYDEVNLTGRPLTAEEIAAERLSPAEVAAINEARARSRLPRSEGGHYLGSTIDDDPFGFLGFIAYRNLFYQIFGFEIPLISTEGGATVGSTDDRRYPRVSERLMAEYTIQAFEYMLDRAPAYYFANNTWLLAEQALGAPHATWESWAWYHDRAGNHLPVVERLKAHPRRGEARRNGVVAQPLPTDNPTPTPQQSPRPSAGLDRFPRPPKDNGWGIHWVPTLHAQPAATVDRFVNEAARLGIKWVKIMQADQPKVEHEYLIHSLVKRGIMPILRVYRADNTPYEHLEALVRQAVPLGVHYFELYNEPNVSGESGGWRAGERISPERIADNWLLAAQAVVRAGGLPGTPAPAPGGNYEDTAFLKAFLRRIVARGQKEILAKSWIALHNYLLNHPLDYPEDPVNLQSAPLSAQEIARRGLSEAEVRFINDARASSRRPRSQGGYYRGSTIQQDSNAFRKFETYNAIILQEVGFAMPILSTEGGAIPGTQEDPRYPRVTDSDVAEWTAGAFRYMVENAPPYYFAFTPWLLANLAGGGSDYNWEDAAWFKGYNGEEMPVVDAVRRLASEGRPRSLPRPQPEVTQAPAASRDEIQQGWFVFWRDGEPTRCLPTAFSPARAAAGVWQPPAEPGQWGLEIRDSVGARVRIFGLVDPVARALPALCRNEDAQPSATPAPPDAALRWDKRLDALDITLSRASPQADSPYWRLVSAVYEDEVQAGGRHHIFVRLLDEQGRDVDGNVVISWHDRTTNVVVRYKESADAYARFTDFPMYAPLGSYSLRVVGSSDEVRGLGLPGNRHVNYLLTFQRVGGR